MRASRIEQVDLRDYDASRLQAALDTGGWSTLESARRRLCELLEGRTLWEINSTGRGGGVAEMLAWYLPLLVDARVDVRWGVLKAPADLWDLTKRLHHMLHEAERTLEEGDQALYEKDIRGAAKDLAGKVRRGDVVVVHDPQPAGLIPAISAAGAHVVWRCHVGTDEPEGHARLAWEFLTPYITPARAVVFSRPSFAWDTIDAARVSFIAPAIDPLDAKNQELSEPVVRAILARIGLRSGDASGEPAFTRSAGAAARVGRSAEMLQAAPLAENVPYVAQVSRWDPLKDPIGVIDGFVEHVPAEAGAHLVLAGPAPAAVADDPEEKRVLSEVRRRWRALPAQQRARVHLALLPMADAEENAAMVNAIQRGAAVVVQKSLREGFGLTVAEAMWKSRAVVAGAVGGIQDQIEDGRSGLLIDPPDDLRAFGSAVSRLLADAALRERLGAAGRRRVVKRYLPDRLASDWAKLIERVVTA